MGEMSRSCEEWQQLRRGCRPHADAVVGIAGAVIYIADENRKADHLARGQVVLNHLIFGDVLLGGLGIRINGDRAELVDIRALAVLLALEAIGAVVPTAAIGQQRWILDIGTTDRSRLQGRAEIAVERRERERVLVMRYHVFGLGQVVVPRVELDLNAVVPPIGNLSPWRVIVCLLSNIFVVTYSSLRESFQPKMWRICIEAGSMPPRGTSSPAKPWTEKSFAAGNGVHFERYSRPIVVKSVDVRHMRIGELHGEEDLAWGLVRFQRLAQRPVGRLPSGHR